MAQLSTLWKFLQLSRVLFWTPKNQHQHRKYGNPAIIMNVYYIILSQPLIFFNLAISTSLSSHHNATYFHKWMYHRLVTCDWCWYCKMNVYLTTFCGWQVHQSELSDVWVLWKYFNILKWIHIEYFWISGIENSYNL